MALPDSLHKALRLLGLGWLFGPIFTKELRVASRRRRSFLLRTLYLGAMTAYVAGVWATATVGGGVAWNQATMAAAGQRIIGGIVWFQFVAAQLIVLIMLSSSVSEEVYRRTLGVLMTTPITSVQIVFGKLASKLLQVLVLLAVSLPLLAVVRVFGGTPWGFVVAALSVTATSTLLAGSVSLLMSILNPNSYAAVLKSLFVLGTFYGLVPVLLIMGYRWNLPGPAEWVLRVGHPFFLMAELSEGLTSAAAPGGGPYWGAHCVVVAGVSGLLLAVSVFLVRRVGLRQAAGAERRARQKRRPETAPALAAPSRARAAKALTGPEVMEGRAGEAVAAEPSAAAPAPPPAPPDEEGGGRIRRVTGPPIIWRELRRPMLGSPARTLAAALFVILSQLATYVIIRDTLDGEIAHLVYVLIFLGLGALCTMVLAATTIAAEKEAGTLPALLVSPLSPWQIVLGKAAGVLRRCLPIWLLLAGHLGLFILMRFIHPIAAAQVVLLAGWVVAFLTGLGLMFSSLLRRTTAAVVATLAVALALWLVAPVLLTLLGLAGSSDFSIDPGEAATVAAAGNPVVQAAVVMNAAGGEVNAHKSAESLAYRWPTAEGDLRPAEAWRAMGRYAAGYAGAGVLAGLLGMLVLRRRAM